MDVTELFSFHKRLRIPRGVKLVFVSPHGKQTCGPDGCDQRIKLQHCLAEGRTHKKDIVHNGKRKLCENSFLFCFITHT